MRGVPYAGLDVALVDVVGLRGALNVMVDLTPADAATPPLASPMSPPIEAAAGPPPGHSLDQQPMASPAYAGAGACAGAGIVLDTIHRRNVGHVHRHPHRHHGREVHHAQSGLHWF